MKVKSEREVPQSCPTLCDPMDCSLPGSSVHGIFQARVLEWGAIVFSVQYGSFSYIASLAGCLLTLAPPGKPSHHSAAAAKSLQSCPTLCDPIDGSLPGSAVPGILQARILERVAISFSNA